MKKIILLFLLFPLIASAQVTPPFAFWKSGAAAFSPTDIDSLVVWSVSADLADSLGKSDGDTTYILPNRVTPGASYYQLTETKKPVFRADSNVLVFDGIDDGLLATLGLLSQPNTVFIVARYNSGAVGGSAYAMDGGARCIIGEHIGPLAVYAGTFVDWTQTITADSLYIHVGIFNTGTIQRVNGAQNAGNAGVNGISNPTLGGRNTLTGNHANISLREILIYDGLLTDAEVAEVETYLAEKYGVMLP